jgi:hypothetical protein
MNRLEEGALGDPVLAGNSLTLMGTADPPVASEQLGRSKLGRAVHSSTDPGRIGWADGADATP